MFGYRLLQHGTRVRIPICIGSDVKVARLSSIGTKRMVFFHVLCSLINDVAALQILARAGIGVAKRLDGVVVGCRSWTCCPTA